MDKTSEPRTRRPRAARAGLPSRIPSRSGSCSISRRSFKWKRDDERRIIRLTVGTATPLSLPNVRRRFGPTFSCMGGAGGVRARKAEWVGGGVTRANPEPV